MYDVAERQDTRTEYEKNYGRGAGDYPMTEQGFEAWRQSRGDGYDPPPDNAMYQGVVDRPERVDHSVERGRQEPYAPPVMPEVGGAAHTIKGTLAAPQQPVTGERNGVHRGYDVETDFDAIADYFTKR